MKPFKLLTWVTWPLMKQPWSLWMLLVRLQKNLRFFCFQKSLWLDNLLQSKCPGSSSYIVKRQRESEKQKACNSARATVFPLVCYNILPQQTWRKVHLSTTNWTRLNLINNGFEVFPCSSIFVTFRQETFLRPKANLSCKVSFKYQCLILHGQTWRTINLRNVYWLCLLP